MAEENVKCCYDATSKEVIEKIINDSPSKQEELTLQIDQVATRKEELQEQANILKSCIEDCSANMLEGILHALARQVSSGGVDNARGIWKDATMYSSTNRDIVVAPIGTSTYGIVRCTTTHESTPAAKPFVGDDWTSFWVIYPDGIVHPEYDIYKGPNFNKQEYGVELTDWKIVDSTTGLITYYVFESGPWWGLDSEVDEDVTNIVGQWNATNDLVTRPLNSGAFYGLEPLADALQKAEDGLRATREKVIAMVPILSKFI